MQKALTLGQQALNMKSQYPRFASQMRRGTVNWTGTLTPTEMSAEYQIKIGYTLGSRPEISVLNPQLRKRPDGERIPHLFPSGNLCLYQPRYGEWLPTKFVADTIVPWAALWLYYYEVWQATGEWIGGGEHPIVRTRKSKDKA